MLTLRSVAYTALRSILHHTTGINATTDGECGASGDSAAVDDADASYEDTDYTGTAAQHSGALGIVATMSGQQSAAPGDTVVPGTLSTMLHPVLLRLVGAAVKNCCILVLGCTDSTLVFGFAANGT
jgi:hypothetical protein